MKTRLLTTILLVLLPLAGALGRTYDLSSYGVKPGAKDLPAKMSKALSKIQKKTADGDTVVLKLRPGKYHFHSTDALVRNYYVSNHDQSDSKNVGIAIEDWKNLVIDGCGAELIFHGIIIPVAVVGSENVTLKNFSVDFENPQIPQIEIVENRGDEGMVFRPAPWVKYRIDDEGFFEAYGEGWTLRPTTGIGFEPDTRHILWNTGDLFYTTQGVTELEDGCLLAPSWKDRRLTEGTEVAMRAWRRPAPGIFLYDNLNTNIEDVNMHYAFGMGLVAQLCDGITLDGFRVCLRNVGLDGTVSETPDERCFTTQADATHFSQCRGLIKSVNGFYEGMMDDAINIHGVYLKIISVKDSRTVVARYMHGQAWGFRWGDVGDTVRLLDASVMEYVGDELHITEMVPVGGKWNGVREIEITFDGDVNVDPANNNIGIENLSWTPEVIFSGNVVRNNRARGALFSSPKRTVVENNLFDHTSGTAILLCGDCNGWYESGPCYDVLIRNNRFVNALTSMYQFTDGVISIWPEIPALNKQTKYFHGGKPGAITIVDNTFETFDMPLLYAKSVDGLVFKNNTVIENQDYKPFHRIKSRVTLVRTGNVEISY